MSETPKNKMLHRPGWLIFGIIFGWLPILFAGNYLERPGINLLIAVAATFWAFVPSGDKGK
jgi:hypothetical protein